MRSPDPFEHDDAAYVMGILPPDERQAFEAHLLSCDDCAERVRQLSQTTAQLAQLDEADLLALDAEVEAVPDTLLPGLLRRAGVSRRRQRWVTSGLSALAAACLIALAVIVWPSSGPSDVGRPQAMAVVASTPLRVTAALTSVRWGTRITLDCSYQGVAPQGTSPFTYGLMVVTKDGSRYALGTWTVTAGAHTKFTSGVAVPDSQIRSVQITSYDGTPVLALNE